MNEADIKRINELYHKMKNEGLTDDEKEEQAKLRKDYVAAIRQNMINNLDNVSVVNPDGSVTHLADVRKKKEK